MDLGAHLGDAVCFLCDLSDMANFRNRAAEGFLAVDMFLGAHSGDTGNSMGVIGSRHDYCVEVLLLNQSAEIGISLSLWELAPELVQM